jgi:hypothetical protein
MNIYEKKKIKKSYFILLSNKKTKWVIFSMPLSPSSPAVVGMRNQKKVLLNLMVPREGIKIERVDLQVLKKKKKMLKIFPLHVEKERMNLQVHKEKDPSLLTDLPLLMVMVWVLWIRVVWIRVVWVWMVWIRVVWVWMGTMEKERRNLRVQKEKDPSLLTDLPLLMVMVWG